MRGILVFAKTPFSAKELNRQLTDGSFGKYYCALVDGVPPKPEDTLTDYMIKNGRTNLSSICAKDQPGAKQARLTYRTVAPEELFFPAPDVSSHQTELEVQRLVRKGQKRMQITDVRVRKVAKEGKLKAVVSITMDDEFVVHDIKVIEGEKGVFIAMPSKKALDGEYRDIAHPINSETRERIQKIILEKYEEALAEEPEEV